MTSKEINARYRAKLKTDPKRLFERRWKQNECVKRYTKEREAMGIPLYAPFDVIAKHVMMVI